MPVEQSSRANAGTCAACGYVVFVGLPDSGRTCPWCGWIDDFEQLVHPDLIYGANSGMSLRQAQRRAADVSREVANRPTQTATYVRDPLWRPLRTGETPLADDEEPSSPVCYIATPDPSSHVPYWLRSSDDDD